MTEYRKQSDGTIVVGNTAFKNLFPNTSFPRVLDEALVNSFGYDWVYDGAQPSVTPPYQSVVRDGVEQVSGRWQTKFKVVTADSDGQTIIDNSVAKANRTKRNQLLQDSDWTQLADKGGLADSKVAEWVTYRQSLRDLPTASGWPHTHTFPTEPS
tara:strand:- start:592 stop:1056 length:465 start_codon:yes stop_codon:yes gene_type:complete